jgi:gliding motility-associated-like protein
MTNFCFNPPSSTTDQTFYVFVFIDGLQVYQGGPLTGTSHSFCIDLTDVPGGYNQSSVIEIYALPNTFNSTLPTVYTTFNPNGNCGSLADGEWTADFDLTLDVTFNQTIGSPVDCSFDIAEPQACCGSTNLSATNPATVTVQCSDDVPLADPAVVDDETSDCAAVPTVTFVSETSDNNTCNGEELTRIYEVADDCGNTIQVTHTIIIDSDAPTFTIVGTDPTTCGGTDGFITIGGLDPNTSYEIGYDGNGTITVTTDINGEYDITLLGAGSYTDFSVAASSCALCEFTDGTVINLVDPNGPTPTITGDTDYCQGQTAAISTGAFSNYNWSNGANTQNTAVTDADNPITVTVTDASGCSGTSAPYTVTENPSPTPTITGATTYCVGNSASISAPAGFSNYNWSNGANTQGTNVTDADNPITVTVTDANGCTGTSADFTVSEESTINYAETIEICQGQNATIHGNVETTAGLYEETFTTAGCDSIASITLVVNALPTITASATEVAICDGESTDLSASGGDTYTWDNGLPVGPNHTVSPTFTTTYEVTGEDANGCTNTDQIEITVNPLPTVNAGNDIVECEGATITLSGSGTATTYTWDNGISDGAGFTQPVGTVTYTVTGEDANGCTNTDQVDVTIQTEPTVNAGTDIVECEGTTITLTGSGTAATYTWDNGVTDGVGFNQAVGTVTYTVTGTTGSTCSATDQIDVTINASPNVDAGADQSVCAGDNVTLSGSGADDYTWDNGVTDGVAFTPGSTTTYTVTGEDLATGCTATDDVTITVNSLPTVDAGSDQAVCEGEEIVLSGTGADSYSWDNGVVGGAPFVPGSTTTYTVTGTDANGCENTASVTVTLTSQPNADFTATINSGQAPLDVDFINNSTNGTVYDWNFGNGQSTSTGTPTDESMTYTNPGSYVVVLTISNGACTDQASTTILVEDLPLIYNIPNVFTPNGDDSNDLLHMGLVNAASLEMEIFNRWGNLVGVVNSTDSADGWDGRHINSGNPVLEGVYFYTYKIVDLNGEEIEGHEYVHLNR